VNGTDGMADAVGNVGRVTVGCFVSVGRVEAVGNVGKVGTDDDGVSEGAFGPKVTPVSGSFGAACSPPPCRASAQLVAAMAATATMEAAMVSGIRPGRLPSRPASSAVAEPFTGSVGESFSGSFAESGFGSGFCSGGPHPSVMRPFLADGARFAVISEELGVRRRVADPATTPAPGRYDARVDRPTVGRPRSKPLTAMRRFRLSAT